MTLPPPKESAKAQVLVAHKYAFCCHCFVLMTGHPAYRSRSYEAVFATPTAKKPLGTGDSEKQAWESAAANLKGKKR